MPGKLSAREFDVLHDWVAAEITFALAVDKYRRREPGYTVDAVQFKGIALADAKAKAMVLLVHGE